MDDAHLSEFLAILAEIEAQAIALGAARVNICADTMLTGDQYLFDGLGNSREMGRAINTQITTLMSAPREHALWARPDGLAEQAIVGAFRLVNREAISMGALGLGFVETRIGPGERKQVAGQVVRLGQRLLQIWQDKVSLELNVIAERARGDRLQRQSERDPLTTLANASAFRILSEDVLAQTDSSMALILLDVDNFKTVNDVYGHQFGDRYLQQIGRAITATMPQDAIIGRLGGDEFAVLLPTGRTAMHAAPCIGQEPEEWARNFCLEAMDRSALQIQRAVAQLGKADLGGISMGAAIFPAQANRLDRLFELADAALYFNKGRGGKRRAAIFDAIKHDAFSNRLLSSRFQAAVERGHIEPFLQPVVDLQNDRITSFEALVRWRDPRRGLLTPGDFQQVFRDPDMAQRLTSTIARSVVEWLAMMRAFSCGSDVTAALNLTTLDLINPEFVFELDGLLRTYKVPWSALIIEVTETVMLGPTNGPVFRTMVEMRSRGARIALDDFGTGYGGLKHLRNWPIDILKIDRCFLAGAEKDGIDRSIVRGVCAMARELGLKVVAEGIESLAAHEFVREIGCDFGQGYLYSRALNRERARAVLLDAAALSGGNQLASLPGPINAKTSGTERPTARSRKGSGKRASSLAATKSPHAPLPEIAPLEASVGSGPLPLLPPGLGLQPLPPRFPDKGLTRMAVKILNQGPQGACAPIVETAQDQNDPLPLLHGPSHRRSSN